MGRGLIIGFIKLLQPVTTSTVLHSLQITVGHRRSSHSVNYIVIIFGPSRYLQVEG
jgi:hypothetical protein